MKKTYTAEEAEILMRAAFMMGVDCPSFSVDQEKDENEKILTRLQYLSGRCTQALQIIWSNESEFLELNKVNNE